MRCIVLALAVPLLGFAPAHAQDVAVPQKQGTEGHYCQASGMDKAELYRRHDVFFCFLGHRRFPASLTVAAVGPRRREVKRMVVTALVETKPVTGFTEAAGTAPDIVVVATARHPSSAELRAGLTAQGFVIEPKLDSILRVYDMPAPSARFGLQTGGWYGDDGAVHIDGYVASDRLSASEARTIALRALGIGMMLNAPPKSFPDGHQEWSEDPRTFVPAKTHMP